MALPQKTAFSVLTATEYNAVIDTVNAGTSVQQTGSFTSSSSITTAGGAILTITSCVFAAGWAYDVILIGGFLGSTTLEADVGLHKNAIGTQIGAFYRTPAVAGGAIRNGTGFTVLRRTAITPITFDLIASVTPSTGTVTHEAASNRPRQLIVRPVGAAADYPNAFDVT